jgi:hypothetical protein
VARSQSGKSGKISLKNRLNYILWIFPVLGILLGYAFAYLFFHGFLATWQFAGNPGEKIVSIHGIRKAGNLLVNTQTGKSFSLEFGNFIINEFSNNYEGEFALQAQPKWEEELLDSIEPVRHLEYYGADFFTLPPHFRVQQLYDWTYIYRVEGKGEVKFALAADGNLWVWNHQIAGLTGLVFYLYPVIGFFAGLVIVRIVAAANWLKDKSR